MVGRELGLLAPRDTSYATGEVALSVTGLSRRRKSSDASAIELHNVSLAVNKGEILGIAGLVGAGRTETARAIFGADVIDSGKIIVNGAGSENRLAARCHRLGIGLVPEDRKQQALFLALAIRTNLSIASHDRISSFRYFISKSKEEALVDEYKKLLNIRMASGDQLVGNLSGGNQQKVVLARWLALRPKVLIVDEPTRGIDVGAKVEVHNLLFQMAAAGIAIIVISSELPEILSLADRIVTMREGRVTGEILRADADQEKLMTLMTLRSEQGSVSKVETKMAEATLRENDKAFDAFSFLARFAPLIFLLCSWRFSPSWSRASSPLSTSSTSCARCPSPAFWPSA